MLGNILETAKIITSTDSIYTIGLIVLLTNFVILAVSQITYKKYVERSTRELRAIQEYIIRQTVSGESVFQINKRLKSFYDINKYNEIEMLYNTANGKTTNSNAYRISNQLDAIETILNNTEAIKRLIRDRKVLLKHKGRKSVPPASTVDRTPHREGDIENFIKGQLSQEERERNIADGIVADIVHTFRNSKVGMLSIIQILKANHPDATDDLNILSKYLSQMDNDLSVFSPAKSNSNDTHSTFDFEQHLKDSIKLLTLAHKKEVNIAYDIHDTDIPKETALPLALCLKIITDNAIHFCTENSTIAIALTKEEDTLISRITNYGGDTTTINDKDDIFTCGFSTRGSTGRGLSICKRIVNDILSGRVDCENVNHQELGTGVQFTLEVPRHHQASLIAKGQNNA